MNNKSFFRRLMIIGMITSSILILTDSVKAETSIERLVTKIVGREKSNNEKMFLIEKWINENITYISDKKQFNMTERWTLPTETLQRKRGDCEDGSILLIAMAVTAGVPSERLKLYAPIRVQNGWHASVAYQREHDDDWIWVEWAFKSGRYYDPIDRRKTISEISAYEPLGTYFTVTSLNPFNMVLNEEP